jgi:hypothetical protein
MVEKPLTTDGYDVSRAPEDATEPSEELEGGGGMAGAYGRGPRKYMPAALAAAMLTTAAAEAFSKERVNRFGGTGGIGGGAGAAPESRDCSGDMDPPKLSLAASAAAASASTTLLL